MPRAPKRCGRPECDERMPCPEHAQSRRKRPPRQQRGYDADHEAERAAWEPKVQAGQVHCRRGEKCRKHPNTLIVPGTYWQLGHPDAECPAPRAPEHRGCNTGAPGRLRNKT